MPWLLYCLRGHREREEEVEGGGGEQGKGQQGQEDGGNNQHTSLAGHVISTFSSFHLMACLATWV